MSISATSLGNVEWFQAIGFPPLSSTLFRLDGEYYAKNKDLWWASSGGIRWSELAAAPDLLPTGSDVEGVEVEIYEVDGETWATVRPSGGSSAAFKRVDHFWEEAVAGTNVPEPAISLMEMRRKGMQRASGPLPTDFGWLRITSGGQLNDPNDLEVLISSDGVDWEEMAPGPKLDATYSLPAPLPVMYQAGLFVRELPGLGIVVGRFER